MQQFQGVDNNQTFSVIEMSGHTSFRSRADISARTTLSGGMGMPAFKNSSSNKISMTNGINWQGGSGRHYSMCEQPVSDFLLKDKNLYMLVANNRAIWVGTRDDLVSDSASRAQFRTAISYASAAYEMKLPSDDTARICLFADLLNGQPASKLHAA